MDQIIESEMTFGPYPEGEGFRVEDSAPHKAAGDGVKMVEFYKLHHREDKPSQIWLVEAKQTAPKSAPQQAQKFVEELKKAGAKLPAPAIADLQQNADWLGSHGPRLFPLMPRDFIVSDFSIYFNERKEKMENGLRLFFATRIGRHSRHEDIWPKSFRILPLDVTEVRLLLVIKDAEKEWLPPLNDTLRKVMRPMIGTWGLGPNAVGVLTEDNARQHGLIANAPA